MQSKSRCERKWWLRNIVISLSVLRVIHDTGISLRCSYVKRQNIRKDPWPKSHKKWVMKSHNTQNTKSHNCNTSREKWELKYRSVRDKRTRLHVFSVNVEMRVTINCLQQCIQGHMYKQLIASVTPTEKGRDISNEPFLYRGHADQEWSTRQMYIYDLFMYSLMFHW